jgi:hypothetical protein
MSIEYIFFSGVAVLAAVTIFLGISNWIFLSSMGSKIAGLEDEIEKKAVEFESLKKEKQAQPFPQEQPQLQMEPQEHLQKFPADSRGHEFTDQEHQQIEIVRNVPGGGFQNLEAVDNERNMAGLQEELPPPAAPLSDILDVVEERPGEPSGPGRTVIRIPLYSNASKDTDFTVAWKKLSEQLARRPAKPLVEIDFANVMFLYEKELTYLEKFEQIIGQAGGVLAFVNCDPELMAILRRRSHLAGYAGS